MCSIIIITPAIHAVPGTWYLVLAVPIDRTQQAEKEKGRKREKERENTQIEKSDDLISLDVTRRGRRIPDPLRMYAKQDFVFFI